MPDAPLPDGPPATYEVRTVESPHGPPAAGGYSQAVSVVGASELLFISGQIPVDRSGAVPPDFATQCRQVWANVLNQVTEAAMTSANLVKVTTFLADRANADENRAIRSEILGEHAPALTVVITGIFDEGWLLEIEAIAAR
ncbi:MAG: RidA family protein [Actinomycetota bacterium]|nr:RidA family protein [Actinomycetota bacterium]